METTEESRPLLTGKQVRERLGLVTKTGHTLREWELAGKLHPHRINSRVLRYKPEDIDRLIEEGRSG